MADIDYTPAPIVGEFVQHYLPKELFYAFIVGPFGSAKTTGALFKIAYMAALQDPSPIDNVRRSKAVVVRNTAPQLRDTTIASWNYWFKDGVAGKWFATKNTFLLKFADVECEVLFRALDTADDISKVLSLEITFAVLDEFVQIAPEIREGLSGRCGRYPPKIDGGATNFGMWGASNPGEEDTEWYKFLIEEKPDNVEYFHQPSGLSPQAENLENLPPAYYENLSKGKSEAWRQMYIEANWGYSVAGKPVVPTFNRELHVAKSPLMPNPHLPLVIGYDPGVQHSALIFGQHDLYGRLLVLDELVLEGYGAQRMAKDRLIPLLRAKYAGMEVIIAPDPAANSRTQNDETTVVDGLKRPEYRQFWSVKVDDTNLLTPRLEAIEHFTTRLTEKGPALLVSPTCKALIRALQGGWRYKTTKSGDEKPEPDKNIHSHPCFVAGTLVATPEGQRRIEDIVRGDAVMTPFGARLVVGTQRSLSRSIARVTLTDGTTITSTPEHPYYTSRCILPADALAYSDILLKPGASACSSDTTSKNSKASSSTTSRTDTTSQTTQSTAVNTCTDAYGSGSMGRFRQDTKCITKTGTGQTTVSKILGCLLLPSIRASTCWRGLHGMIRRCAEILGVALKRKRGTRLKKAEYGTPSTVLLPGQGENAAWSAPALFAASDFCRSSWFAEASTDIAALYAARQQGKPAVSTTRRDSAVYAEGISELINTQRLEIAAPIAGVSCWRETEPVAVYDLEVAEAHCFFAEGVLVSNCDGLTYLARYHVKHEARFGRRGQAKPVALPRFGNPYAQR